MARLAHASLLSVATIYYFAALGCSSSNDPSTSASNAAGTSSSTTTTAGTGPTLGNTAGSTSETSGGSAAAGTNSTTAGTSASSGGSGGSGGSSSAGTSTGTAGTAADGSFTPLCDGLSTAAGPPTKAGACNATDPQLCYKTCGPQGVGFKSETCTAGAYAEQSGCTFPDDGDYSCFKVPTAIDAACPADTITASTACTVKSCTACADQTGSYYDSKMNLKTGFCVCPEPSMPGGTSKWSCASNTAWPCPTGKGC